MALDRYSVLDAYVLEELRRNYEAASDEGRIQLLRKLQKGDRGLPFEIAAKAVHDPSSQVRRWVARHVNAVDIEPEPWEGAGDWRQKAARSTSLLIETLKGDSDPFVRACLRENPGAFGGYSDWTSYFVEATHIERLALMRNPEVGTRLVEKVFDPEENSLGVDMQARRELCRAFLNNKARLHRLIDDAGLCPDHKGYWEAKIDAEIFLGKLWELAAKWSPDSDIPYTVFDKVPANGLVLLGGQPSLRYVKSEIYQAHPQYRLYILYSCNGWDDEVVRLGLQDEDENCRQVAFSKLSYVPVGWVEELIRRKDKSALEGLTLNESLSAEELQKIQDCLNEINPDGYPHAWITIERKQKSSTSQDPERLFGKDGRGLLEEKVNFIGQTLTKSKTEVPTHKSGNAVLWARIAAVASVLTLVWLLLR